MKSASEMTRQFAAALQQLSLKLIRLYHPQTWKEKGIAWTSGLVIVTLIIINLVLAFIWSREPAPFSVEEITLDMLQDDKKRMVTGSATHDATRCLDGQYS